MVAYLNELSLPKFNSVIEVIGAFDQFGNTYKISRAAGIREIKIQDSFYIYEFSHNYSFSHWLQDNRADDDLRTLFKSVFGTVPFVDEIFENYQLEYDVPLEMKYQGQTCIGLGLSSDKLYNTVAFSFDDVNWRLPHYTISINLIKEDDDGNLIEKNEDAISKNISSEDNWLIHQAFVNEQVARAIPNGAYLWINKEILFPNLIFCDSVGTQIGANNLQNEEFRQIVKTLFVLQNTAINFDGHPIKPADFPTKASPESQTRINKYSEQLYIVCPDGYSRLFSWHLRYTPGAGRIHFFPVEDQHIIYVGYIGKKIE